jgi:hypothetical protein
MNAKTLYALIAAAVVALFAALWINASHTPTSESAEQSRPLLPGLREQVNDVDTITLTGAEAKVLATLKRGKEGWIIVEKSNYPVDPAKLREFLLKLADATVLEQKTGNPKLYPTLGVEDVKDNDAKGVLVDLNGLKAPVRLIVGNFNGAGGGGTFVRREGETASWLVKGNLLVDKTAAAWEAHELANIPSSRLKQVVLVDPDGKTLKAYKEQEGDSDFRLADVPKGREPASAYAANGLASVLADLKADDVFAAKDEAPGDKVYNAHYAAFDGLIVDMAAWEKGGKDYAQFKAALDSAAAEAQIKVEQDKATANYQIAVATAAKKPEVDKNGTEKPAAPLAVSDPAKDREERMAALNKEVETLNKTFAGWTFVLPNFKFSNVNKTMDDLLKPLETKKDDAKDSKNQAIKALMKPGLIPQKPAKP